MPSRSYGERNCATTFSERHCSGAFVPTRVARDKSTCLESVHQANCPRMGEAENLAELAQRAVRREVQQRDERRRRSAIQTVGFGAEFSQSIGQPDGRCSQQICQSRLVINQTSHSNKIDAAALKRYD